MKTVIVLLLTGWLVVSALGTSIEGLAWLTLLGLLLLATAGSGRIRPGHGSRHG